MNSITPLAIDITPNFDSLVISHGLSSDNNGPVHLLADPVLPLDAATKQYVDALSNRLTNTVGANPPAGPINGQTWFDSVSAQLFVWYVDPTSSQWVIANNTGIQDAPISIQAFGRQNATWVPVLPLGGGIMTGPLVLHEDPTAYFMAATKGYVDLAVAAYLPLTGGTLTGQLTLSGDPTGARQAATKSYVDSHASIIPISDIPPANPANGQAWFDSISVQTYIFYNGAWVEANSDSWATGGTGPAPPLGSGVASFNSRVGDIVLTKDDVLLGLGYEPYNSTNPAVYQTLNDVDNLLNDYVKLTGATLTGPLTLVGNASSNYHAVPFIQVNTMLNAYLPLTGGTISGATRFATVGFNNTPPIGKPTVLGSKGGNAALASLMTALANYGLIIDSTT